MSSPQLRSAYLNTVIRGFLKEDLGQHGDITSRSTLPENSPIISHLIAKENGVLCGIDIAARVFGLVDSKCRIRIKVKDGERIKKDQVLAEIQGPVQSVFAAERVALNLLGHLSGIAALTRKFVDTAATDSCKILDTRKTIPGLRAFQRYAVTVGGGTNHRDRLDSAVLIKTNHLRAMNPQNADRSSSAAQAVQLARSRYPRKTIEIEVANFAEFEAVLDAQPDIVLLDNWKPALIRKAVEKRNESYRRSRKRVLLEVSGGIRLNNVHRFAHSGVDRISVGALTHSAPVLDVSLRVVEP